MTTLFPDHHPEIYRESDHVDPLSTTEARQAAEIAKQLLALGGWTGAQINGLERIASSETDNAKDALYYVEHLRDAREREEALKK